MSVTAQEALTIPLVVIKNSNFFPLKSVSHLAAFPVYIFQTILLVNNSSILIKGACSRDLIIYISQCSQPVPLCLVIYKH